LRIKNLLSGNDTDLESMGFLQYLTHEPVWRYILMLIGERLDNPANALLFISFFSIFIYAFFLFGRVNLFLASFFLYNPMIVDLVMAQVRSAFAVALLLIALMMKNRMLGLVLVAMVTMVHTITFLHLMIYMFSKFMELNKLRVTYKQNVIVTFFFALVLSVILGGGRKIVLGAVGDRRADELMVSSSFIYLVYWILLALVLLLLQKHKNIREYWIDYYSVVMLALPFLMAIFGAASTRLIPLSLPIVLYSITARTALVRIPLLASLFAYQIVQYYYWLNNF